MNSTLHLPDYPALQCLSVEFFTCALQVEAAGLEKVFDLLSSADGPRLQSFMPKPANLLYDPLFGFIRRRSATCGVLNQLFIRRSVG
jgi:hypothetical protein